MGSVLGSFVAIQGNIWSVAPFIPVGDQEGSKISILPRWIFSWTNQPRPISKCKLVLDIYFRPFSSILEVTFFWKMAICKYLILVIFGQFWLLRADFAPKMWKVYLFQLFRCKNINGTKKMGPCGYFKNWVPEPTLGPPKTPKHQKMASGGPKWASMHLMWSNQLVLGQKKLNRSVPRCVPFTRNQPVWYCHPFPMKIFGQMAH